MDTPESTENSKNIFCKKFVFCIIFFCLDTNVMLPHPDEKNEQKPENSSSCRC